MANNSQVIAWSECQIEVGAAGESNTSFTSIGVIKDQSAELTTADGNTLEMKSTGGHTIAYEQQEGTASLACRVIEPDAEFFELFGCGEEGTDEIKIKSLVVGEEKSVRLTPKNVGAYGILAPFCSVSIKTGWSEVDGNYADLTFGILNKVSGGDATCWYKMVKKKATS